MDMPDGNTAAELQYAHRQAEREIDYDERAPDIIEELADTIVYGGHIKGCDGRKWYAADFVNDTSEWEIGGLITLEGDELANLRDHLRKRMTEEVSVWLRDSDEGTAIVERELADE